jgi:hypothetical protein
MTSRLLRSGLTAVLTIVILVAGASLVRASDPLWIYARCTEGSLASAKTGGQDNVIVVGSAAACGLQVLDSSFGVAIFEAGAKSTAVFKHNLRPHYAIGSRDFGMEIARKSGTFGACLVNSPKEKIACAKITFNKNSGYVEFRTIQPTDTLVNATISGAEVGVDPRCGACF